MQSLVQSKSGAGRGEGVWPGNAGERSEPEWTGNTPSQTSTVPIAPPDPEVLARPVRRRFTKEYRLAILEEVDRCKKPGEIGAILRREGLFSSYLHAWRLERKESALAVMQAKKRGPKSSKNAHHPGLFTHLKSSIIVVTSKCPETLEIRRFSGKGEKHTNG